MSMSLKQRLLRWVYPLFRFSAGKINSKSKKLVNKNLHMPSKPFHELNFSSLASHKHELSQYKGKKVLIVNTASECGYTGQYAELEALYKMHGDKLTVIAFPSNDFGGQEPMDDEGIERFCSTNYHISFPIARKSTVQKTSGQHPVYQWLTDPAQNGWNHEAPEWNFGKFLINEAGTLTHYWGPAISPLSDEVVSVVSSQ